jgi:hypothetical protein
MNEVFANPPVRVSPPIVAREKPQGPGWKRRRDRHPHGMMAYQNREGRLRCP